MSKRRILPLTRHTTTTLGWLAQTSCLESGQRLHWNCNYIKAGTVMWKPTIPYWLNTMAQILAYQLQTLTLQEPPSSELLKTHKYWQQFEETLLNQCKKLKASSKTHQLYTPFCPQHLLFYLGQQTIIKWHIMKSHPNNPHQIWKGNTR